jgi:restriction system protein
MIALGYGSGKEENGKVVGKTGDEGIDGIIYEDALGLERIYLQAKKYKEKNNISIEHINSFNGAMLAKGTSKGVLITTSTFTQQAKEHAKHNKSLVLIDGSKLVELMFKTGLGLQVEQKFIIQKIDLDYFNEGIL